MNRYTATLWLCKKGKVANRVVKEEIFTCTAIDIFDALYQAEAWLASMSTPRGHYWVRHAAIEKVS